MGTVGDKLDYLKETKEVIKTALINKGQTVNDTDTFRSYGEKIDAIKTEGNYQEKSVTPKATEQTVTADNEYDALSSVTVEGDSNLSPQNIKSGTSIFGIDGSYDYKTEMKLQEKSVMPVQTGLTVVPDDGYDGLSQVGVFGDVNLVPENIKSGVTIFGVEGTSSGGGVLGGTEVTVQATHNFSAGDTFVGTAISGAEPKIYSVASGLPTIVSASADSSVAVKSQTITATSTTVSLYIQDGDVYTEVIVALPDMTDASSTSTPTINEDGTIVAYNHGFFIVVIYVDKENKTATAERIDVDSVNLAGFNYSTSTSSMTPYKFTSGLSVRKKYLTCGMQIKTDSGGNGFAGIIGKISAGGIRNEYVFKSHSSASYTNPQATSGVFDYNGNDCWFITTSSYTYRVEFSLGEVVSINEIGGGFSYISDNGEYAVSSSNKAFKLNKETGTYSTISTFSSSITAIDETGEYVAKGTGCYRITDTSFTTSLGTINSPGSSGGCFKIVGESYVGKDGKRYTLLPSSEAEYSIAHTSSVSTEGDIYGIVTEAMTMGETKTAMKIFNK